MLILLGRQWKSRSLVGIGIVAVGLMVLLTPLAFYLDAAIRGGALEMSPGEVVVFALLAFLGGFVANLGIPYLRSATRSTASPSPGKR